MNLFEPPSSEEKKSSFRRSWSTLAASETDPKDTPAANNTTSLLRFFIWLSPGAFIFGFLIAFGFMRSFSISLGKNVATWISISIVIAATSLFGYLDKRLSLMQNRIAPPHSTSDIVGSITVFLVMQLIIAPVVFGTLVIGLFILAKSF